MTALEQPATREQSRARYPDEEGCVERDGVRVFYEVYGSGDPTILFVPPWAIVHSRVWKLQVPYLARHGRVVTFDPRGNGKSDRPRDAAQYGEYAYAADALAVLDATETEQAFLVTMSLGAQRSLILAAEHPNRIRGIVCFAPSLSIAPGHAHRDAYPFDQPLDTDEGWAKFNAHYWLRDYPGFVEFFISQCVTEPHSTKPIEDGIGWGLETDGETLLALSSSRFIDQAEIHDLCGRLRCPMLVILGVEDEVSPHARGVALAAATGATFLTVAGGGHFTHARDPVRANLAIREFVERLS